MKIGQKVNTSSEIADIHSNVSNNIHDALGGWAWMYVYRNTYGSVSASIVTI